MAAVAYLLCALTALSCFVLLFRAWRANRAKLLFWSALCFAGLTISNSILVVDKLLLPLVNLTTLRLVITLVSALLLLYGLTREER